MTPQELEAKLTSLTKEQLVKFNTDFGGGQKSIEERVREYVDNPTHERRLCHLLSLKTESEKITDAALQSAASSARSASSARLSIIFAAIAGLVAVLNIFLNFLYEHEDFNATILTAAPLPFVNVRFTADVIFTNNGNKQCAVAGVDLLETQVFKSGETEHTAEAIILFSENSPFSLKPNDVVSKQFTIAGKAHITESGFAHTKKVEKREWRLGFHVIDSKGKYHIIKVPLFWSTVGEDNYQTVKYPIVVKLLPSPAIEESSLALPLLRPPEKK